MSSSRGGLASSGGGVGDAPAHRCDALVEIADRLVDAAEPASGCGGARAACARAPRPSSAPARRRCRFRGRARRPLPATLFSDRGRSLAGAGAFRGRRPTLCFDLVEPVLQAGDRWREYRPWRERRSAARSPRRSRSPSSSASMSFRLRRSPRRRRSASTWFSHSPTESPDRRAASMTASRVSSSTPLQIPRYARFHRLAPLAARPPPAACRMQARRRESAPAHGMGESSANMVNKRLTCVAGRKNFGNKA